MFAKTIRTFDVLHVFFWLSISRSFFIFFVSLTHFLNFLQSNHIDIESIKSQCEIKNLWNVKWIQMSIVNTLNFCFRNKFKRQIFVSQMYFLFDSKYQIAYRCFILWKIVFKTLHFSNIRSIVRSHVLQIDFTLYLKSINLSNFYSFVFAIFASMYDLILKFIALKKFINNDNQSRLFFNKSKIYRVEKVCSKISKYASLKKLENSSLKKSKFTSLKKFVRKF